MGHIRMRAAFAVALIACGGRAAAADDPAGAISPSDLGQSRELPAVQRDQLPADQADRLPAGSKDRLPAVQQDERPAIREDARPAPREKALPAVQDRAPARLRERGVAPTLDDGAAPSLKDRAQPKLRERVRPGLPETAPGGERRKPLSGDGGFAAPASVTEPESGLSGAPIGDPGSGSLELPSDLQIVSGPVFREGGGGTAGSRFIYGDDLEVVFEVRNNGDRPARFRPAYDFPDAGVQGLLPERTIDPAEIVEIRAGFQPHTLGGDADRRIILDGELTMRVYAARATAHAGDGYHGRVYQDARMSNHSRSGTFRLDRRLRVQVTLDRIRQFDRCDDWVQKRDWELMVLVSESLLRHTLEGRPPLLEGSVRATHGLDPPLRYTFPADPGARELSVLLAQLYALKDNGSYKNSGRSAAFDIAVPMRTLAERERVSGWVRSHDRGGSFCGSDLALRYELRPEIVPPG